MQAVEFWPWRRAVFYRWFWAEQAFRVCAAQRRKGGTWSGQSVNRRLSQRRNSWPVDRLDSTEAMIPPRARGVLYRPSWQTCPFVSILTNSGAHFQPTAARKRSPRQTRAPWARTKVKQRFLSSCAKDFWTAFASAILVAPIIEAAAEVCEGYCNSAPIRHSSSSHIVGLVRGISILGFEGRFEVDAVEASDALGLAAAEPAFFHFLGEGFLGAWVFIVALAPDFPLAP